VPFLEDEATHDFYLVFGMGFATDGDAQLGFWFVQDDVQPIAGGDFSGAHQDGDLLVLVNFSQGGTVPNIEVWTWNAGTVILTAVGGSVECTNGSIPDGSDFCGIVNDTDVLAPWAYENKDFTVTNTGEERLNNVSVDDDKLGNLIAGATLDPGQSITFQDQSYIPSAPDQEPIEGDKYDPETAMFTNTVTVEGEGEISGELLDPFPFDSTTCDLCQYLRRLLRWSERGGAMSSIHRLPVPPRCRAHPLSFLLLDIG
jgi:hypothetical protein